MNSVRKHPVSSNSNTKCEQQFICNVLRQFATGHLESLTVPKDLNWSRLNAIVTAHNLGPIFKFALKGQRVFEPALTQWGREQMITLIRNTRAISAAIELCQILDEAEIPSVVVRGLSLANTFYPDASLRPMTDVDILINPKSCDDVAELLKNKGIYPDKRLRSQFVYYINNIAFEIHWSLLTPKRYRIKLSCETLIEFRRILSLPGGKIYILLAEEELLGLITHAFIHHELERMLSLLDMALLIAHSRIDWEFIATWCKKNQLSKMVYFTLSFINYLFSLRLEDKLELFKQSLSTRVDKIFDAYIARLFDTDNIFDYLKRKRNLFFVAEQLGIKLRQAIRFITYEELREFVKALHHQ